MHKLLPMQGMAHENRFERVTIKSLSLFLGCTLILLLFLWHNEPIKTCFGPKAPATHVPRLPRIAVSLLLNEISAREAIHSLLRSDITDLAEVDFFVFSNSPTGHPTVEFQNENLGPHKKVLLTADSVVFDRGRAWLDPREFCPSLRGTQNLGIVLPRLRIMMEVLKVGSYDWLLESHDDIYYPRVWFKAMIKQDGPRVGILMPRLVREVPKTANTSALLDTYLYSFRRNDTLGFSFAAHPWYG